MTSPPGESQWERILVAGAKLADNNQTPFSAELLIVSAWGASQQVFGIKGYSDLYPDSNKVIAHLVGAKGLIAKGFIRKVGPKLYEVTYAGRKYLSDVTGEPLPGEKKAGRLQIEMEKSIEFLERTVVMDRFEQGRKEELTFKDALAFWGGSYTGTDKMIRKIAGTLDEGPAELSTGQVVNGDTGRRLINVHAWLVDKFSRHLKVLDERKV